MKTSKQNEINRLLVELKKLNLPEKQYVIYGSGPLGVRRLRAIHDLDVVVTNELYQKLLKKYPEIKKKSPKGVIRFIRIGNVELIPVKYSLIKNIEKVITNADIIKGFRFVRLEDLLEWKKIMGRPKDFEDIKLIKKYLKRKRKLKNLNPK